MAQSDDSGIIAAKSEDSLSRPTSSTSNIHIRKSYSGQSFFSYERLRDEINQSFNLKYEVLYPESIE